MKFTVTILDYLGKIEKHVMCLLSVGYNGNFYDCTFMYDDETFMFTEDDDLNIDLGHNIEEDTDYATLLRAIYNKVLPYKEIYNSLDEFNLDKWYIDAVNTAEQKKGINIHDSDVKKMDSD